MKRAEIEANARKPYADAIRKLTAELDAAVDALRQVSACRDIDCARGIAWRVLSYIKESQRHD